MSGKLIPVILSGGAGTRLWPVSRELHPKPFIRLADGESLLQKTFRRAAELPAVSEILTVTNREFYFLTEDEYAAANSAAILTGYVLEPIGRNTAPAIAAAALHVATAFGREATLLVLSADHLIADSAAFGQAVAQAVDLAADHKLVTLGIRPSAPETGYGYIEADGFQVKRFVEKPPLENAKEYLTAGNYLWNAGIFCFTAGTLLDELATHAPGLLAAVQHCLDHSRQESGAGFDRVELDLATFKQVPDISIDYALFEQSGNVAVVPCDIGWSDIGSWDAISNLVDADGAGNRIQGEALLHDVTNCYIQSSERLIGAIGIQDLLIVDTPDALLVADRSRAQDVKHIVQQMRLTGHEASKLHRTVHRPWGTYTVLEESANFKIKRIEVKPGARLSLQMHHHRSEHWVVVSGMARVVNGEQEIFVNTNESTFIPAGHKHRLENPGKLNLVMIEVQSGAYLGEDDIVRFEDQYGRS